MNSDLLTVDECAKFLRVSKSTLYNFTRRNEIPCYRIGRRLVFDPSRIREWLDEQSAGASS